jgi:fused signal recognition particle receptor
VNGAGKTTFIGKFSDFLRTNKMSVLVGAADTFRAGAIDQLRAWSERTGADFVGGKPGSDPAAVAFDAVDAGISRGKDVVVVDTAGRLHTSGSLMDEMKKIDRVIGKRVPGAPHETLLVLDGTIGQNAVVQAKTFAEAIPITGLVITKVDGTSKGGIVLAVHDALNVPVKFIGTGEKATDLEAFDPKAFAREVLEG